MIRSLHIIGSRQMGGAERFFQRLVTALNTAGHPAMAVFRASSPLASEPALACDGIQVPMRNGWDLFSLLTIRKVLARHRPDIVQTYMGRASRLTRVPAASPCMHVARLGGYYKIDGYFRHAHAWVGNTRGLCDYLLQNGLPADRVFQIGNFVTPAREMEPRSRLDLRAAQGIPHEALVLFSLGRFVPKKGFEDLLNAFARLPREIKGRPLWLLLAGAGSLTKRLKRLGTHLGIAQRLRWLGWQAEPGPFFQVADLFVCPSRHEPLGNVILEAWAHRLPVLATRTMGATELIEDDVNGVLVPCGQDRVMAARIADLLADDGARARLAEHAAVSVKRRHAPEMVLAAYLDLYRRLLQI